MKLDRLFQAIDQRPFRPFTIEVMSGRQIQVTHPDNIFIMPNRQVVYQIEVFNPDLEWKLAVIHPEGIVGLLFNGDNGDTE